MKKSLCLFACFALLLVAGAGFSQEAEPVACTDSPSGAAGDLSIQFKGTSSVGAADPTGLLNIIQGPITIETWVKLNDYNDYWTGMVSWGFTYKMGISDAGNGGQFIFTFFGIVDIFSGYDVRPLVGDGLWHHFAAAWEPGVGVNFFVDGAEVGSVAETRSPRVPTSTNFTIGGEDVGKVPITACMDRVRIHNAALTAAQLDSVAASPKAPLADTMVHYGFDETHAPYISAGSVHLALFPQNAVGPSSTAQWDLFR
ncbi:MAG: LamG domain-containing protein [Candidatus Omnitrophota bacterium]|jgi:hypothetical protein|nr:MAG: LamG domain-containing protein [Candidatus Omnitrophota bacterium]